MQKQGDYKNVYTPDKKVRGRSGTLRKSYINRIQVSQFEDFRSQDRGQRTEAKKKVSEAPRISLTDKIRLAQEKVLGINHDAPKGEISEEVESEDEDQFSPQRRKPSINVQMDESLYNKVVSKQALEGNPDKHYKQVTQLVVQKG